MTPTDKVPEPAHPSEPPPAPFVPGELDAGIRKTVELLRAQAIETCQSCEGGQGHACPEPTIEFYGVPEAGWRAVGLCFTHKLPISELRRVWDVLDGIEPTGPIWQIVFKRRPG